MKKIGLIALLLIVAMSGCSLLEEEKSEHAKMLKELYTNNDWDYDKVIVVEQGKKRRTDFFDFTIYSTETVESYGETVHEDEESEFLVVGVEVKNTFKDVIPVGTYDFAITYEINGKFVEDYAYEGVPGEEAYPDEYELAPNEKISGEVVFSLPKEATLVSVTYQEIYVNENGANSVGDVYIIPVK